MSETIKNRSEILFIYDVTDANPNGDPFDDNKPRIDEETGINFVTDVRLKRTIRDYLYDCKKRDIFIRPIIEDEKTQELKTKEKRLSEYKGIEDLKERCIDIRLFGATIAVKNSTIALIGPVQFKYGHSLHQVELRYVKGTTVMPSGEDKTQGTFTGKYILPYSLIAFYGIVNEKVAETQNINLTQEDIDLMFEAMWYGTKDLISTSKFEQVPRFLLQIEYKEGGYHMGALDNKIKFVSDKKDESIRKVSDGVLDITVLVNLISENKEKINRIRYKIDSALVLSYNGQKVTLKDVLNGFTVEEFVF